MTKQEFKNQIHLMTQQQQKQWYEIFTDLVHEVNMKEFKTKAGYKNAMDKVYEKAIQLYVKKYKK